MEEKQREKERDPVGVKEGTEGRTTRTTKNVNKSFNQKAKEEVAATDSHQPDTQGFGSKYHQRF